MFRASFVRIASKALQGATKYRLGVVSPSNLVAPPLQAVPWHVREFSSLKSRHDDEVLEKTFSSDHDEADSLEAGKEALRKKDKKKKEEGSTFRSSATINEDVDGRELYHKNFSDEFDEADSIEAGKEHWSHVREPGADPLQDPEEKVNDNKTSKGNTPNATEVLETQFKSEFDESDSIEVGKDQKKKVK